MTAPWAPRRNLLGAFFWLCFAAVPFFAHCATATKAPDPLPMPPEDTRPYCDHIISIEDRRLFCGPKTLAVDVPNVDDIGLCLNVAAVPDGGRFLPFKACEVPK